MAVSYCRCMSKSVIEWNGQSIKRSYLLRLLTLFQQSSIAMKDKLKLYKLVVLGDGGVRKTALTIQVGAAGH